MHEHMHWLALNMLNQMRLQKINQSGFEMNVSNAGQGFHLNQVTSLLLPMEIISELNWPMKSGVSSFNSLQYNDQGWIWDLQGEGSK